MIEGFGVSDVAYKEAGALGWGTDWRQCSSPPRGSHPRRSLVRDRKNGRTLTPKP